MAESSENRTSSPGRRTRTQELAARYVKDLENPSPAEVRALVNALEVHEMELLAQNDQLRATQKDLEASVADLRRAEEALRIEHGHLARILDAMQDGAYIADEQFVIRYANPALLREFGPVVGQRCFQCLAERPEPCESCQNADVLRGRHVHVEWQCPRTGKTYEAIGTPLLNADGTVSRLQVLRDITERKQMENARDFLLQVGKQPAGEDFFRSLARYLAQSLDMDFVCIDRLASDQLRAKTVAVYDDGQFQDNIEYALKDTPCGEVVAGDFCCITAGVRQQFPQDSVLTTLRAESYAGVIIRNTQGKPIGLIAVIGRKPLADAGMTRRLLELVALRAANELERADAVEALRASEQRYRSYVDLTGQIGWTTNAAGAADDLPAWRRFTGQTCQEVTGWGWINALHPDDVAMTMVVWRKAVADRTCYETEYRIRRSEGEYRHFLVRGVPLLDSDGTVREWVGTCIDITDRHQAEEASREANAKVSALLESITDAFFSLDREFRVTYINGEAERILGKSRAEMINRNLWEIFPEAVGSRFHHEYEQALAQGHTTVFEEYYPPMEAWFSVRAYPFAGGLSVFFADITDRKLAETRLARASEELARSNRDLQQFASVASHDLQAPLRMIWSFLTLLKERYGANLDDKAREFIAFAVDGARRMSQLISDLLDYARVGSRGGEFKPIELQTVLDRVLAERRASMAECRATLTHDVLPSMVADEGQMVQLLSNLVGNAIKYRLPDRPPVIHIGAERGPGHWRISVRDNGIGIDPKDASRVFEIFQRLHAQGQYEGTGIGLAICKRIVERHGGVISLESRLGQGATFWFTIPDRT